MVFSQTNKEKTTSTFFYFKVMVEKQFSLFVKMIQVDGGNDFTLLVIALEKENVMHRCTYSHTSKQNGVVESCHVRIIEWGLDLLLHSHVPIKFYMYAIKNTIYLPNMTISKVLEDKFPFKLLYKKSCDLLCLNASVVNVLHM